MCTCVMCVVCGGGGNRVAVSGSHEGGVKMEGEEGIKDVKEVSMWNDGRKEKGEGVREKG